MPKKLIDLCRLSGGQVSIRLDGREVFILPPREKCDLEDLEVAFNEVVDSLVGKLEMPPKKLEW